jgi:hypothetical protein
MLGYWLVITDNLFFFSTTGKGISKLVGLPSSSARL